MLRNRLGLPQQTHTNPNQKKGKGSRDFPFRVGPLLAAGVSRASSATWAPSARPLVPTRALNLMCASPKKTSLHQHSDSDLYSALLSLHSLLFTHSLLHTPPAHSVAPLSFSLLAPPSFGCVSSISANRERTRPPPPAFLVTVTGSFFARIVDVLAVSPFLHSSTVKPPSFVWSFGGKSRRRRTTAPFVPRGMSPHGARLLWV